jgi:hypothetical protein
MMERFLVPMRRQEWLPPSQVQKKTVFGDPDVRKLWIIKAVLSDGFVKWRGTFEDREDADAFLWAIATGTLDQEPVLWRLPVPMYMPDYGEGALFLYAATITITSGTSQAVPGDWDSSANTVEGIGGGGSGSCGCKQNANRGTGGSGAEYRKIANFTPGGGTFSYVIGAGGAAVARTTAGVTAGNDGADTTFNTTSLIAKRGLAGTILNASTPTAPAGGTGGTGAAGNANGGAGGATGGFNDLTTGAGGAGGPNGAGNAGATGAANNTASNGGSGDAGSGGVAGTGALSASAATATGVAGGNGTEFGGSPNGSGGGGGGAMNTNAGAAVGGDGGSYGAGGGGSNTKGIGANSTSGAGLQGIIYITYTPLATTGGGRNLAMMGM